MRLALLVFFAPLVSTSPALAQSDDHLEPLPAVPATPEPAAAPAAPPAPSAASTAATDGHADAPATATAPPSPCPCTQYRHRGFYLGYAAGFGFSSNWGEGPTGSASISGGSETGAIDLGGTVADGLVIGGELRAWITSGTFNGGPSITTTVTNSSNGSVSTNSYGRTGASAASIQIGPFVDWYPNPADGWHVGASIGLGSVSVTDAGGNKMNNAALAASLFGGYQWWIGPSWSLGLTAVTSGATKATLTDSNQNDTAYRLMPLSIGVETLLLYY